MSGRAHDKPYTAAGIGRMPCARWNCLNKAKFQWQICADNNRWRPICADCDVELNEMVLRWIGDPETDVKLDAYREKVYGAATILRDPA
jgi:hypothetical protein